MIVGSVCSGIGAPECAWHPLGWRSAFLSEIEAFPRAVLAQRFPCVPIHGDFTTIQAGQYEPIDLLVGGTPCQSFSVAGLRGGLADERGNLALEYLRLADRLRPRWLVWENVPGVLSSSSGRDFGAFLGGLGQLGYGFAYRVLDAQFFGVPQRRRRVFVVGYLGDWRRAAAVLFEPASLRGHPAPRREAGEKAAPTIARGSPGGRRYGEDADTCDSLISMCLTGHPGRYDAESQTLITGTLCSSGKAAGSATQQDAEAGMLVVHTLRGEGFDASEDGTGRGTPIVPCLTSNGDAHSGFRDEHGLVPVVAGSLTNRVDRGGVNSEGNDGHLVPVIAGALCRSAYSGGAGGRPDGAAQGHFIPAASAVRCLTPEECEALQGFKRGHTAVIYRGKAAADGPRYKGLGNSMAVPVLERIGQRIERIEMERA